MKIIADFALTTGTEEWPLCAPTFAMGEQLRRTLGEAINSVAGIELRVVDRTRRWDWIDGAWVLRMPSDGPAYGAACYEDVDIFSDGEPKGVLRVRRVTTFDPKKEPCGV